MGIVSQKDTKEVKEMNKMKAILFLAKCFFYIAKRIIAGKEWNMMTVSLENKDGEREGLRYMRKHGSVDLSHWINRKDGSTDVLT
jgi:hypothetical protein